jgi:hypothetical protein
LDEFVEEAQRRTQGSPRPLELRLITTWSDGENGAWFREAQDENGFFGAFFAPCMERVQAEELALIPVGLSDFLEHNPPTAHARVQTGAWSAGSAAGDDFSRWTGSENQKKAVGLVQNLSRRYWEVERRNVALGEAARQALARARSLILECETSCFLFWGDAWIPHLYERTVRADRELGKAERELSSLEEGV